MTIIISFIGISSIDDELFVPDIGLFSQFEVVLVANDAAIKIIIEIILG